ncbi:unnamed protein product [Adineta steineri]|uniref:Uncharacterized protein n=1 Tax=Adineta steineri TaxID=433720 RepID=A0A818MXV7_9BILA|nr:unnamed protein product [Adineta steineri]CAF3596114.1 unnamed protein product [Adineta steineri]
MNQQGKPVRISTQDRLMSTSFRYEMNKGKPDSSAARMQKVAEGEEVHLKQLKELNHNKYAKFITNWAEQSAWSNVAARESAAHKQRDQELILLRKAHLTARQAALATLLQNEEVMYEQEFRNTGMALYKDMTQVDPQYGALKLFR